jgi:nucleotide-binding universal stress UspA family protein
VVMATHGRTGLGHLVYGSVAETVVATSHVPVFLIHAGADHPSARSYDPRAARILVPLDGSALSAAALQTATELLGDNGSLSLVTVAEPPDHVERDERGRPRAYLDQQEEAHTRAALEYLDEIVGYLSDVRPGLEVSTQVLIGSVPEGIVAAAANSRADLIVMSTHGRTGVRRAAAGSVAGEVLAMAGLPVVLVPPVAAAAPPERVPVAASTL